MFNEKKRVTFYHLIGKLLGFRDLRQIGKTGGPPAGVPKYLSAKNPPLPGVV